MHRLPDQFGQIVNRFVDVKEVDLGTRQHHPAHNHVVELKHVIDQRVFTPGKIAVDMSLAQQCSNLFFCAWPIVFTSAMNAHQS